MNELPKGNFEEGRSYLVAGKLLNAMLQGILQRTLIPGDGIEIEERETGTVVRSLAGTEGTGAGSSNAFWRVYQDETTWMLQGGQVTPRDSDDSNVDDIAIGTVGSEPADGTLVWLEITGTGVVSNGRLYGGFKVTAVADDDGTLMGADTFPTVASSTGRKCHVLLGGWQGDVFFPATAGSVSVEFCPGAGYRIRRF